MAEETKAFLDSPVGRTLLLKLAYSRPQYSSFSVPEKRLIESGTLEGYEQALLELQRSTVIAFEN
jgi:hypothetical protein